MPYPPGTVLAGKYRIEKLLGVGGMGWVVEATHVHLEQRVALKFMHAESMREHPDSIARFLREARAAARIQSEHIARVFDVGTLDDGSPYLVMEYLEGQDIEGLLRQKKTLPVEQVVDYAMQACEALAEAHAKGIVHRDLKPANLFLARQTDGSVRVKLLDFGISKLAPTAGGKDAGMTSTQALMGSPLYMSPEQLRSSKNVDRRTDLWSMGIILYEMLGGESPFVAQTLPEVCSRIMAEPPPPLPMGGKGIGAVVMRCLEKDPQNRFSDAGALAMALAPFGAPEMRSIADKIARVVRSSDASLPGLKVDGSGPLSPMSAAAASGIAQTSASFGTVHSSGASRRSSRVAVVLAATALVAVAAAVAVFATRKHVEPPTIVATPPGTTVAPAAAPSGPTVVSLPAASSAPSASASAPPVDTPAASSAAVSATTPPPPSPARPPSRTKPAAATAATTAPPAPAPAVTTAKPASTSGFGGRD
jgi:serine/threonine-protein kinase